MIQMGKINVMMGGQWGSEGKGKLAGWLFNQYPIISIVIGDNMPNAGHTYIDDDGHKIILKQLPVGSLFKSIDTVILGPYSVIDLSRLEEEIKIVSKYRGQPIGVNWNIYIHPCAAILNKQDDVTKELKILNPIASTMTGGNEAVIRKMHRCGVNSDAALARGWSVYIGNMGAKIEDTAELINDYLIQGLTAMVELPQGFDLSLNHGLKWPYVTSRDCMIGRAIDNCGVSPKFLGLVGGAIRTYPIRVGNTEGGFSGPIYDDQKELSWENISDQINEKTIEYTTVTGRIRRIFTFSQLQLKRYCRLVRPDWIFLNYINYLPIVDQDEFINQLKLVLDNYGVELKLIGYGSLLKEMRVYNEGL